MQTFETTPLFWLADDTTYATQVLRLEAGHTEDSLEAEYVQQAQELGVEQPSKRFSGVPPTSISVNTLSTVSSGERRSASISSRNSYSTGLTSNISRSSLDFQFARPSRFLNRRKSPAALSVQNYDPDVEPLDSNSPSPLTTPADSTISLPLDGLRRPFSVRRGFSRFSKLKRSGLSGPDNDSAACCQGVHKHRTPVYRLSCGHMYCAPGLRAKVLESMTGGLRMPPSCCGQPIAGVLVQAVITREEQDRFLNSITDAKTPWSDATSVVSSLDGIAAMHIGGGAMRYGSSNNITDIVQLEELAKSLQHANSYADFRALRQEQEKERERFVQYRRMQFGALMEQCQSDKHQMEERHRSYIEELSDRQSQALALIEDRHVAAEMDLRTGQEQELRNCLTAIRHMEAYCSNQPTKDDAPTRIVTEQDKKELEKQYWLRDNLDQKHCSAINVLREQQAQRMNIRMQRQEAEMSAIESRQEQELKGLEQVHEEELNRLEEAFAKRKFRMVARWDLILAIWRKRLEKDAGVIIHGPIPGIDWPDEALPTSSSIIDQSTAGTLGVSDDRTN